MANYEAIFNHYFKSPILTKYVSRTLDAMKDGHTCVEVEIDDRLALAEMKQVCSVNSLGKPFVLRNDFFSFQRYAGYEWRIVDFIKQKVKHSLDLLEGRKKELLEYNPLIDSLFIDFKIQEELSEIENIDWQKVAVLTAFLNDFCLITGGPGTGKTTTVSKLLTLIFSIQPQARVALTAQTGKAAARLKESLDNSRAYLNLSVELSTCFDSIEPKTLHRLLGYRRKSVDFKHHAENPLPYDLIIVDESSMVDLPMMAKLMQSIGKNTKLILLGDKEQLPSVELGAVFGDLCESVGADLNNFSPEINDFLSAFIQQKAYYNYKAKATQLLTNAVVQLRRSYRFSSKEALGKFANDILTNQEIDLGKCNQVIENQGVVSFTEWSNSKEMLIFSMFKTYISANSALDALKAFNLIKVLAATHEGTRGVKAMNLKIEQWLEAQHWIDRKEIFYIHRPILITKNDYNLGVYNGDVGIVRLDEKGERKVYFEDGLGGVKAINPSFLKNYETVFAMTVHKSQGSEFQQVLLVLPNSKESEILNRQLVYTAITRAKQCIYIYGDQEVFDAGLARKNERLSNIKFLLENE